MKLGKNVVIFIRVAISVVFPQGRANVNDKHFGNLRFHYSPLYEIHSEPSLYPTDRQFALDGQESETIELVFI